jgi:hypothetical protein
MTITFAAGTVICGFSSRGVNQREKAEVAGSHQEHRSELMKYWVILPLILSFTIIDPTFLPRE